jgi:hypothetical protein
MNAKASIACLLLAVAATACGPAQAPATPSSPPPAPSPTPTPTPAPPGAQLTMPKRATMVEKLPDGADGLDLRDGRLRLKQGYRFVPQPMGRFAIENPGGGTGASGGCGCKSGGGTCEPKLSGGIIVCAADGCTQCGLALTIGGTTTEIGFFE